MAVCSASVLQDQGRKTYIESILIENSAKLENYENQE